MTLIWIITLNIYHDDLELNDDKINLDNISTMIVLNQLLSMMLQKNENERSSSKQLVNQLEQHPKFIFDQVSKFNSIKLIYLNFLLKPF